MLQGTFAKLDLVTRDEFEAQQAVLMRTRDKLEQLEQRLAALEPSVENPAPAATDNDTQL
jgi:BMFP domain-containing protein YqiC